MLQKYAISVTYIKPSSQLFPRFDQLNDTLEMVPHYQPKLLNDYCPDDPRRRYDFLQSLKSTGLQFPILILTHSTGNNVGNMHFVWRVPLTEKIEDTFDKCQAVIESLKPELPKFHTRTMRKAMFTKFGRVAPSIKPAVLRCFYRDLTGDKSASNDHKEEIIDQRVLEVIEMEPEEPSTIFDLREVKSSVSRTKYQVFWGEAQKFINENIGTAVDDRRHTSVTHLAMAISIRDFREQVAMRCPDDSPIPSAEWVRLQFWPKSPKTKTAIHYTGRLDVRFMVQARQFRKTHEDQHYAAAVFRYLRELAVKFRDDALLVCLDDKHRCKIGEPGFPVAAAERGRRCLVTAGTSFQVGDHDFTKFSVIPSATLINEIPSEVSDSWYRGKVKFSLKEAAFEPSSPMRHMAELRKSLDSYPQKILQMVDLTIGSHMYLFKLVSSLYSGYWTSTTCVLQELPLVIHGETQLNVLCRLSILVFNVLG